MYDPKGNVFRQLYDAIAAIPSGSGLIYPSSVSAELVSVAGSSTLLAEEDSERLCLLIRNTSISEDLLTAPWDINSGNALYALYVLPPESTLAIDAQLVRLAWFGIRTSGTANALVAEGI